MGIWSKIKNFTGAGVIAISTFFGGNNAMADTKLLEEAKQMEEVQNESESLLNSVLYGATADKIMENYERWDLTNSKRWDEDSLKKFNKVADERSKYEKEREKLEEDAMGQDREYENSDGVDLKSELEKLATTEFMDKDSTNDILRLKKLFEELENLSPQDRDKFYTKIIETKEIFKLKKHLLSGNQEFKTAQKELSELKKANGHTGGGLRRNTPEMQQVRNNQAIAEMAIMGIESKMEKRAVEIVYSKTRGISSNDFLDKLKIEPSENNYQPNDKPSQEITEREI